MTVTEGEARCIEAEKSAQSLREELLAVKLRLREQERQQVVDDGAGFEHRDAPLVVNESESREPETPGTAVGFVNWALTCCILCLPRSADEPEHTTEIAEAGLLLPKPHTPTAKTPSLLAKGEIDSFDEAIDQCRFGPFQWMTFVGLGAVMAADAAEIVMLSLLVSCLKREWDLSASLSNSIVSVVFAGEMVGTLASGPLAGSHGRKTVSLAATVLVAAGGFASSFATNIFELLALQGVVGVGIGCITVPFDLLAEITPKKWRGVVLSAFQCWWCFGSLYTVAAAELLFKHASDWRWLTRACTAPVFLSIFTVLAVPESPRWLLSQARATEAEASLQRIARWNGVPKPLNLQLEPSSSDAADPSISALLRSSASTRRKLALLALVWAVSGFIFYGISLLLTRVFGDDDACSYDYRALLVVYFSEVAGTLLLIVSIDVLGRPVLQAASLAIMCVGVTLLGVTDAPDATTISAGFVGLAASTASFTCTWIHAAELFDTTTRTTAHALVLLYCSLPLPRPQQPCLWLFRLSPVLCVGPDSSTWPVVLAHFAPATGSIRAWTRSWWVLCSV